VLILFSIEFDIRPASAAGVFPAGLNHLMHHFPSAALAVTPGLKGDVSNLSFVVL
jgi:hypothetical protein